jgi:hypothetical protein
MSVSYPWQLPEKSVFDEIGESLHYERIISAMSRM